MANLYKQCVITGARLFPSAAAFPPLAERGEQGRTLKRARRTRVPCKSRGISFKRLNCALASRPWLKTRVSNCDEFLWFIGQRNTPRMWVITRGHGGSLISDKAQDGWVRGRGFAGNARASLGEKQGKSGGKWVTRGKDTQTCGYYAESVETRGSWVTNRYGK